MMDGAVVTENIVRWISEFYGHGRQYRLDDIFYKLPSILKKSWK
jgi:hypothetical protein